MDPITVQFTIGQVVHHVLFDYRGVVFDVDPCFSGTEDWYEKIARSRPAAVERAAAIPPAATSAITGRQYIIKRADSSNSNAQAFVIAPGSGDAIDGSTSNITGIDDGTSHTLICIGTSGWILVDKYVGI